MSVGVGDTVVLAGNEAWKQSRGSIDDDIESMIMDPLSLADISRQGARRDSEEDSGQEDACEKYKDSKIFSVAMGIKAKTTSPRIIGRQRTLSARANWLKAAAKARALGDPWEKFHLDEYPVENAKRYRYNALKKVWVEDFVVVKMEPTSFNRGAMRECYRMKKLSNFCKQQDWGKECNNYVAKKYLESVDRNVYFEDVKLQMDAKLWGEEFNRHNPPKKVDIIQMCVIELTDRPNKPVFHLEHFIDGAYVKYNSNSGFVGDECRQTPHAFSHFTFERSGHELLVVDVQGVGDLYTDPQIHTVAGKEYGDGNLGTRGMALFFHTHVCNAICGKLGLSPFDLASPERAGLSPIQDSLKKNSSTRVRADMAVCRTPSNYERTHLIEFLEQRSRSGSVSFSSASLPRGPSGRARFASECVFDSSQSESRGCGKDVPGGNQWGGHGGNRKNAVYRCASQPYAKDDDDHDNNNNYDAGMGRHSGKLRYVSGDSVFRSSRSSVSIGSLDEEDDEEFCARTARDLNFDDENEDDEKDSGVHHASAAVRDVSFAGSGGTRDSGCPRSLSVSSSRCGASESSGRFAVDQQARRRSRQDSECSGAATTSCERDRLEFSNLLARKARKTDVHAEKLRRLEGEVCGGGDGCCGDAGARKEGAAGCAKTKKIKDSVLGQIHLDLAKYHELGRFSAEGAEDEYDREAALFHLRHAADLGILEAVVAMAQIHLGLPHDILSDVGCDDVDSGGVGAGDERENAKIGFQYMMEAANAGDRNCSVRVARAYDSGIGLPDGFEVNWLVAAGWYEKLCAAQTGGAGEEDGEEDEDEGVGGHASSGCEADPRYVLRARLAEMLTVGGHGLEADPTRAGDLFNEAAEEAMAAMKGRLANQYYTRAEEAYALASEEAYALASEEAYALASGEE